MGERTVPPATNEEFGIALTGLRAQARYRQLNIDDVGLHCFINDAAELIAQLRAEVRHLHNLQHPKGVSDGQDDIQNPC